jgi:predicted nucleic acid-binding protein
VDHLRSGYPVLTTLLNAGQVMGHHFVIGEIALGSLSQRGAILVAMHDLPIAMQASDSEVQAFIESRPLFGLGIGYIDAHLLASTRLTPGANLWTRDKRLHSIASRLDLAATPQH